MMRTNDGFDILSASLESYKRLNDEIIKISARYKKRDDRDGVKHSGYNSGDLRRLQALVYIKTGERESLKTLHHLVQAGKIN